MKSKGKIGSNKMGSRSLLSLFLAGVDGFVTIMEGCDTSRAFFRRGIHRFEKNFKSKLPVLFYHLRQAGLIDGKSLLPTFLIKFLFPAHLMNLITLTPALSPAFVPQGGTSRRQAKRLRVAVRRYGVRARVTLFCY